MSPVITSQNARDTLNFYVFRTDGTLLFEKDSVTLPYAYGANVGTIEIHGITNTNTGAKLMLFNRQLQFFIYGLCGSLPEIISTLIQSSSFVKVFPNPSSGKIYFNAVSPGNLEDYELIIYNSQFQTIKTVSILAGKEIEVVLDCENLNSGTYFYCLQNKNKIFQSSKFIISK
ncbi:MAG: T9SS type A sorting domain-containing protein [Bacteroidota bacterium]